MCFSYYYIFNVTKLKFRTVSRNTTSRTTCYFSVTYNGNRYDFFFPDYRTDLVPNLMSELAFLCLFIGIGYKEKSPLNVEFRRLFLICR